MKSNASRATQTAIALLVLASIGALLFLLLGNEIKRYLDDDVFKLTYQFILLVVIGGATGLIFKQVASERDASEADREKRRTVHDELLHAYNIVKRIRRSLRASIGYESAGTLAQTLPLTWSDYQSNMDELDDQQLVFESYKRRASTGKLFNYSSTRLADELTRIEKYLNQIGAEYRGARHQFEENHAELHASKLPLLAEFIGSSGDSAQFQNDFKYAIRKALDELVDPPNAA